MTLERVVDTIYHSIVVIGLLGFGACVGLMIAILCIPYAVDMGLL